MGSKAMVDKVKGEGVREYMGGVMPRDSVENARFAVNFFTSIGLGEVTEELREFIKDAPKLILE